MKYGFYVGFGQPNDRVIYYTGKHTCDGSIYDGNVEEAHLFEDMAEVCEYLKGHPSELRYIIYEIADVTIERIQQGYQDIRSGNYNTEYAELYRKFNRASYVMNSEGRS